MNGHAPNSKKEDKKPQEIHTNPDYMPALGGYVMEIPEKLKDKILITNLDYDCYENQNEEISYEQKMTYNCESRTAQAFKTDCNGNQMICIFFFISFQIF